MIAALTKLKTPALLDRFLREVVTSRYDGSENAALLASVNVLGDAHAAAVPSTLVSARMPMRPNECAELLRMLSENPSLCFPEVAEAAVAGLDSIGTRKLKTGRLRLGARRAAPPAQPPISRKLTRGVTAFQWRDSVRRRRREDRLAPQDLQSRDAGRSGHQTALCGPPADWRLNAELSCPCPDCRELQAFASDPTNVFIVFFSRRERAPSPPPQHDRQTPARYDA
jgi:hypothetical protein